METKYYLREGNGILRKRKNNAWEHNGILGNIKLRERKGYT